MTELSTWAKGEEKIEPEHYYIKDGDELDVRFEGGLPIGENKDKKGKEYANFKVVINNKERTLGINKDTLFYKDLVRYLAAEEYELHVKRSGRNISISVKR